MNKITTISGSILLLLLTALLGAVIFTFPSWYIWNHIVAPKFDAPLFTFWEAFWTLLMIRFILPNVSTKTEKN
jgi:heme/copper-type cytochrome/quinol oxidase subunit 3